MGFFDKEAREINFKVVYYGPGFSGKTTNMQYIYLNTAPDDRGQMRSLATETERVLFFDFLARGIGPIGDVGVRFHPYTVPGPVFYDSGRRLILKGVDGIIFVVDSQMERMEANLESFDNLRINLEAEGLRLDAIPIVIQYNKQDLPNALPVEVISAQLNPYGYPEFSAIAVDGVGVFDAFRHVAREILLRTAESKDKLPDTVRVEVRDTSEQIQRERPSCTPEEWWAQLRSLLMQEPSIPHWNELCVHLDERPDGIETSEVLDYVRPHLESWPTRYKRAQGSWLRTMLQGSICPWGGLAERIDARLNYLYEAPYPCGWLEQSPNARIIRVLQYPPGDLAAEAVARATHLEPEELKLGVGITASGARMLAEAPHLSSLHTLDLSRNEIGHAGLKGIVSSPYLEQLQALHVGRNQLQDGDLKEFAYAGFFQLRRLDLDGNALSEASIANLLEANETNGELTTQLHEINLSNNAIGLGGCTDLNNEAFSGLETLFLHNCQLHDEAVEALLQQNVFHKLSNLALSGNQLTLRSVRLLASLPLLGQLDELDICHNQFQREEAHAILQDSPHFQKKTHLCLAPNTVLS